MCKCLYLHVGVYTLVQVLKGDKGVRAPGGGVTDHCELAGVGAGNCTWVL